MAAGQYRYVAPPFLYTGTMLQPQVDLCDAVTASTFEALALRILRNETQPMCRFCSSFEHPELMLAPCTCTEPCLRWTHATCLETYVNTYNIVECRYCLHRFPVHRRPVPFRQYLQYRTPRLHQLYLVGAILFSVSLCWVLGTAWMYAVSGLHMHWLVAGVVYPLLLFQTLCWSIFVFFSFWFYCRMMSLWRLSHGRFVLGDLGHVARPSLGGMHVVPAP
ncbi:E3 ubiquitin-protein ligase MARCHF3-like [Ornithodoros turicata]|uniref:E3 ubiquitin-protein ligase MARCHF3-like n=1 Tax=Ornithodoros turicata TaxID=34597 RepID=UPI0031398798